MVLTALVSVRPGSLGQRSPQAPLDLVRGSVPLRIGVEEVGSFRFCFRLRNSAMKLIEYFGTVPSKDVNLPFGRIHGHELPDARVDGTGRVRRNDFTSRHNPDQLCHHQVHFAELVVDADLRLEHRGGNSISRLERTKP